MYSNVIEYVVLMIFLSWTFQKICDLWEYITQNEVHRV